MSDVTVIGWGQSRFGSLPDRSVTSLAVEAVNGALEMAGLGAADLDAGWLSLAYPNLSWLDGEVGSFLGECCGHPSLPVTRVTNLCAGGLDAVRNASFAIRAGAARAVVVLGVEKMCDVPPKGSVARRYREETHPLLAKGRTAPGMFALRARRYADVYGTDDEAFRRVAVKSRENGAKNPLAHHQSALAMEEIAAGFVVADPLTVAECCPASDGAAAVVLAAAGVGRPLTRLRAITLAGGGDFYRGQFDPDEDYLGFSATRRAAKAAYVEAGVEPGAVDVVECHDCFSVTEILDMEDLGLCPAGRGWRWVAEGLTRPGGRLPVNPSGGLISVGHPVGATGVRMLIDVSRQLTGTAAPGLQLESPRLGLAHALGGPGNVAAVALMDAA
ncbi:MAG TPA: thiolase family protein [Acidimicrobiia bacterium]|nr:thiolase family protein [Acidimicrobiia bacterium]